MRLREFLSISLSYMFIHQYLHIMTVRSTTSIVTPRNRRPNAKEGHSDCTRDWNANVGKDAQQIGKTLMDPTAMSRQMREVLDF